MEEKLNSPEPVEDAVNYQAPQIEEVVTKDALEREVAYAGISGGSQVTN